MGGLFDDIFDDGDFEIASEEVIDDAKDESDDWNDAPDRQRGATWDTGRQPDIWNTDEPWTTSDDSCDSDCDPKADCDDCDPKADCDDCQDRTSPTMDDFFN